MSTRALGKVIFWASGKGYGFIRPSGGEEFARDVFFHATSLPEGEEPSIGDRVTFEHGTSNHRGAAKPCALQVQFVNGDDKQAQPGMYAAEEPTNGARLLRGSKNCCASGSDNPPGHSANHATRHCAVSESTKCN
jgi:cold shock CspA family protein